MKLLKKGIAYTTVTAMGLGLLQPMGVLADDLLTDAAVSTNSVSNDAAEQEEIVILYTNDIHSNIDKSLKYSTVAAYHESMDNSLLVDAGDEIQGSVYGAMDKGATVSKLMNASHYDVATLGNHEFDYGMDGCLAAIERAEFPYLSCNFYRVKEDDSHKNVLDSYSIQEVNGKKVAFIGISTPTTITSSTPTYFMDESRTRYLYGFDGGEDGRELYNSVQKSIDEAEEAGADYIIGLGHLGVDESAGSWTSENVIKNTSGLDAFIDGHSHTVMVGNEINDADGKPVILTQTGSYFDALGEMRIDADGAVSTRLLTAEDLKDVTPDAEVQAIEDGWIKEVKDQLDVKIAHSEIELTINDADGNRLVRSGETNAGDFVADAYYWYLNEAEEMNVDMALMNGGGVRTSLKAGDLTYNDLKTINPFGNMLCILEADGQTILDALEFGARFVGEGENGGFLHGAGITYEINPEVPNTVQIDDKKVWTGAPENYRVRNVKVYDRESKSYVPLDLKKTYRVTGTNYTIRNGGDGMAMFSNAQLVKDYIIEDHMALAEYAKAFKDTEIATANSPLSAYGGYLINYENPKGAGRIKNVNGEPQSIYRAYNPNSGEHFYTPHRKEYEHLVSVGWLGEYRAGWKQPEASAIPIYRVYNPNAGDHHFTTDQKEYQYLVSIGWRDEGIGLYSADNTNTPVYRLYNPNAVAGAHHFTTNLEERESLIKIGWRDEGVAWYGYPEGEVAV